MGADVLSMLCVNHTHLFLFACSQDTRVFKIAGFGAAARTQQIEIKTRGAQPGPSAVQRAQRAASGAPPARAPAAATRTLTVEKYFAETYPQARFNSVGPRLSP